MSAVKDARQPVTYPNAMHEDKLQEINVIDTMPEIPKNKAFWTIDEQKHVSSH